MTQGSGRSIGRLWARLKEKLSRSKVIGLIAVVALLAILGDWLLGHTGRWVVRSFDVGQVGELGIDGAKAAIYLAAELSQLGAGSPPPWFNRSQLTPPFVSGSGVQDLPSLGSSDCSGIMGGPGDYSNIQLRIPLERVRGGTDRDSPSLEFGNISFGGVSIPSELFGRTLLRILPIGYREFGGRITESGDELQVTVELWGSPGVCRASDGADSETLSDPCPTVWSVGGPREALPEMMEYLALRMALDLNPQYLESLNAITNPLLYDSELSLGLGLEQLRVHNYAKARRFLQIAHHFSPLRADIDAMLGVATYNAASDVGEGRTASLEEALRLFEDSVAEDLAGETSLFRPYLACAYLAVGKTTQAERELATFNGYLTARSKAELAVRVESLKALPLRGPNRLVAGMGNFAAIVNLAGSVVATAENGGQPARELFASPLGPPREVLDVSDGILLVLTADGEVSRVAYSPGGISSRPLVGGSALEGVQQVASSPGESDRVNLYLLNRFGEVNWCNSSAALSVCDYSHRTVELPEGVKVKQLLAGRGRLTMLAVDDGIWVSDISGTGQPSTTRRVIDPDPNRQIREIAQWAGGPLYLLLESGNLLRYDEGTKETGLVDRGTSTTQVVATNGGVYLLKNDGAVWRLSDSGGGGDQQVLPAGQLAIQELYMVEDPSGSQILYAITTDRSLYRALAANGDLLVPEEVPLGEPQSLEPHVTPTPVPTPKPAGRLEARLIYSKAVSRGNSEIISAGLDGGDALALTQTSNISEQQPSLCGANQKIAFVGLAYSEEAPPRASLWIMDSDGTDRMLLQQEEGAVYDEPAWSTDCKYLAYAKWTPQTGGYRIHIVDFGSPVQPHLPIVDGRYPSWWTTGQAATLLYSSRGGFISTVDVTPCVVTPSAQSTGCQGSPLPGKLVPGAQPVASPDGTMLVYASVIAADQDPANFNQDLYLYSLVDGGPPVRLTSDERFRLGGLFPQDWSPEWSPDGTRIFFESTRSGNPDIWVISVDGADLTQLASSEADERSPSVGLQDTSSLRDR